MGRKLPNNEMKIRYEDLSLVPEIRHLGLPDSTITSPREHPKYSVAGRSGADRTDGTDVSSLASSVPGLLDVLIGVAKDNVDHFINIVIIGVVVLLETTIDKNFFECPQTKRNMIYSMTFIFIPSITLLFIGVLANNTTWKLVTGCWYRGRWRAHGSRRIFTLMLRVVSKALIAPAVWIIYGFIDSRFYVCAVTPESPEDLVRAREESQIIGYVLLMVVVICFLLGSIMRKAFSRFTYEQEDYINTYRNMERVELRKQMEEQAQRLASKVVRKFLEKHSREKSDWDALAEAGCGTPTDVTTPSGTGLDHHHSWTPLQRLYGDRPEETAKESKSGRKSKEKKIHNGDKASPGSHPTLPVPQDNTNM